MLTCHLACATQAIDILVLNDEWMTRARDKNGELVADSQKSPNGMKNSLTMCAQRSEVPSGNALEFKSFEHLDQLFAK
ncbi:hypothetical protein ACVWYG_003341 [Pedobacter sp. UYEF25]